MKGTVNDTPTYQQVSGKQITSLSSLLYSRVLQWNPLLSTRQSWGLINTCSQATAIESSLPTVLPSDNHSSLSCRRPTGTASHMLERSPQCLFFF